MGDIGANSQEDNNMEVSCHSEHADEGEAFERQNVEEPVPDNDERNARIGGTEKITYRTSENEDSAVRNILTNDDVPKAGDINDGASCSRVTQSPNIELPGSPQEGNGSPSAIEIPMTNFGPNLANTRNLMGIVGDIKSIFYPTEKLTCSAAALLCFAMIDMVNKGLIKTSEEERFQFMVGAEEDTKWIRQEDKILGMTGKKDKAVESKCKPKRSKAMMTIRRQHSDKLMQCMDRMRKENFLCDVELEAAGGVIFKAHRSVLAAACSYFRAMFSSGLIEGKESRVKMAHLSPQTMSTILDFIYTGDLQVSLEEVQELMVVADMLQLEDIINGCSQLMQDEIDPTNALGIYRFAEAHNCTAMSKTAESYVKQNFVEVAKGEEFLSLPLPILTHFLSSEGLEVDSEMQVFESAVRWLFHDPPLRRQHVFEVLSHVRLGLLHPELMSLRASSTISGKDPPLGVALASIRMEVEDRVRGQHTSRYEDKPRRGAKKHIVVLGGCRREPVPSPYRASARSSLSSSSHPGEVLCAAVEVFDVFHKEWLWQGDSNSADVNGRGPPPLLNPRILPGVSTIGGIIYVVGGELESQILANVEALDARACILGKGKKTVENELEARSSEPPVKAESGSRDSPEGSRELDEEEVKEEVEEECVEKVGEEDGVAAREEKLRSDEGLRSRRKRGRHPDPIRWVRVSSMIMPRCEFGLCACGGRLYAIGGWVGSDVDSSIESYDPVLDEWRMEGNLPKPCSGMGAISYE
ncbi:hypothetical protein J437_LFUL000771, partial [Ladona fulva]